MDPPVDTRTLTAGDAADMGVAPDATLPPGEAKEGVPAATLAGVRLLEAGVAAPAYARDGVLIPAFALSDLPPVPMLAFLIALLLEELLAWYSGVFGVTTPRPLVDAS